MEFKVGDKFMCVSDKLVRFTKGKVYEVKEVGEPGDFYIAFEDDTSNESWGSSKSLSEHFRHIDKLQPQVTKVKLPQEEQVKGLKPGSKLQAIERGQNHSEGRVYEVLAVYPLSFETYVKITGDRIDSVLPMWVINKYFVPAAEEDPRKCQCSDLRERQEAVKDAECLVLLRAIDDVLDAREELSFKRLTTTYKHLTKG